MYANGLGWETPPKEEGLYRVQYYGKDVQNYARRFGREILYPGSRPTDVELLIKYDIAKLPFDVGAVEVHVFLWDCWEPLYDYNPNHVNYYGIGKFVKIYGT